MALDKTAYERKLADPRWQKRRLVVYKRDKWRCTKCGNDKMELQVHHLKYLPGKEPWEYPLRLMKTLCADCHYSETVLSIMLRMKLDVEDWKKLDFTFRNLNSKAAIKSLIHEMWRRSANG